MKVMVPVLRCEQCDAAYNLVAPLFLMGKDPEWVYQRSCKHKSAGHTVSDPLPLTVPDDREVGA